MTPVVLSITGILLFLIFCGVLYLCYQTPDNAKYLLIGAIVILPLIFGVVYSLSVLCKNNMKKRREKKIKQLLGAFNDKEYEARGLKWALGTQCAWIELVLMFVIKKRAQGLGNMMMKNALLGRNTIRVKPQPGNGIPMKHHGQLLHPEASPRKSKGGHTPNTGERRRSRSHRNKKD